MKTSRPFSLMYLTGVGAGVVIIGALSVFLHFPGGHKLLFAGLLLVVLLCQCWLLQLKYLPLRDKLVEAMNSGTKKARAAHFIYVLIIVGLCATAVLCAGLCFKLLHWPGGSIVTMMGALTLACVALCMPAFVVMYMKNEEE